MIAMIRTAAKIFCVGLVLLTVAFIFYKSAQPVASSDEASENVAEQIVSVLPSVQSATQTTRSMRAFVQQVRKAAHAVEFFALGAELSVLFYLLQKRLHIQTLWNTISTALAIAVADESRMCCWIFAARLQQRCYAGCCLALYARYAAEKREEKRYNPWVN